MKRLVPLAIAAFLVFAGSAEAGKSPTVTLADGTEQTTYTIGPLEVTSGQNRIVNRPVVGAERPAVDGWITGIVPNLVYEDGTIPSSSKVMFHHGVWLNAARQDVTQGGPERFLGAGEEKSNMFLPEGYGYRYENSDLWILNHMIHNLVPEPMELYITYTLNFIPDTSPAADGMKPVRPIWMDVENGDNYPVFDTYKGSGGKDGEFTYPQDAGDPYPGDTQPNEWTVDQDGVLLGTTGHVHTGGLNTELFMKRDGAKYQGPTCKAPPSHAAKLKKLGRQLKAIARKQKRLRKSGEMFQAAKLKKQKATKAKQLKKLKKKDSKAKAKNDACRKTQPTVEGNRVRLFKSDANYFEPAGPVSWDMAMISTKDNWKVQVREGDVLEIQTTYETKLASWYESMGISVAYMASDTNGRDPYKVKVDTPGVLNHPHYPENDDHGGTNPTVGPDPTKLPDGISSGGPFLIGDYGYEAGDFRLPGAAGRPPVIEKGQSFSFELDSDDADKQIWHSLTSCKAPCNKSTGIAYPIADGKFQFDSGQLGNLGGIGLPPTVGRTTWSTPADLPVGTHTYFCRIHPLMRGAFRVKPNK